MPPADVLEQRSHESGAEAQCTRQSCSELPHPFPPLTAGCCCISTCSIGSTHSGSSGSGGLGRGGPSRRFCSPSTVGTSRISVRTAGKVGLPQIFPQNLLNQLRLLIRLPHCTPTSVVSHCVSPGQLDCYPLQQSDPSHVRALLYTSLPVAIASPHRHIFGGVDYAWELCTASTGTGLGGGLFKLGFGAVTKTSSNQAASAFINERMRKALEAAHVASSVMTALQVGRSTPGILVSAATRL